jgi:hypothetical protein
MPKKRTQTERRDKDAGHALVASSDVAGSAPSAMDKFKALARRIVGVPRREYAEAERRYRESKDDKN